VDCAYPVIEDVEFTIIRHRYSRRPRPLRSVSGLALDSTHTCVFTHPGPELSKSADWVTNMSMRSTYTANLSKIDENFDTSRGKVDEIDISS
jgi:hypothetical protein